MDCGDLIATSQVTIEQGESYSFALVSAMDNPCNGSYLEVERPDGGSDFIDIGDTYIFNMVGQYIIGCVPGSLPPSNASPLLSASVIGACVTVSGPIPTLGEWGLIILSVLLLIIGLAAAKSRQTQLIQAY